MLHHNAQFNKSLGTGPQTMTRKHQYCQSKVVELSSMFVFLLLGLCIDVAVLRLRYKTTTQ